MTCPRLVPQLTMFCVLAAGLCLRAHGQQAIGRVALQDAMVTGTLEVNDGQVMLTGGASIVARDHTAELALLRGGSVAVCATSSLHVTSGASTGDKAPLLFALDRGAIELRTNVGVHDAVITPDLRMSARSAGQLDLRIRVTRNGDTCVESRGAGAPAMNVVEQFGDGVYEIAAGQHVLFEHGSVREVVDHESSPCGCPPTPVVSVAESGVTVAPGQAARAGTQAAQKLEEHPFPAAESQGLTTGTGVAKVPQAPPGQVHAQVTATMAYKADADAADGEVARTDAAARSTKTAAAGVAGQGPAARGSPANVVSKPVPDRTSDSGVGTRSTPIAVNGSGAGSGAASQSAAAPVEVQAPAAPAPPGARDLAHRVGRFFKRMFGGH